MTDNEDFFAAVDELETAFSDGWWSVTGQRGQSYYARFFRSGETPVSARGNTMTEAIRALIRVIPPCARGQAPEVSGDGR